MKNSILFVYLALTFHVDASLREPEPAPMVADEAIVQPAASVTSLEAPDFAAFTDVKAKKRAFFDFMLPLIREANQKIRLQRNDIDAIGNKLASGARLSGEDHQRLKQLFTHYGLQVPRNVQLHNLRSLLERADVVPASLVLAQAANESGWGTSRFAVEANNYFGIWCFSQGCGLVPKGRDTGLNHEVARYDSVADGVAAYMRNINTHRAYDDLRAMRAEQRNLQARMHGHQLAEGLHRYSERGEEYVREIQSMIRINRLEEFTLPIKA